MPLTQDYKGTEVMAQGLQRLLIQFCSLSLYIEKQWLPLWLHYS